ncbi:MAG TPA: P1 family peptidase [Caulobacteraceae bacterium]|nr:P1 family peptidase [Caulobacteraceae bacterium]
MAAIVAMERMGPGYGLRADPRASVRRMGKAGPRNLITDVPGLSVGQAHDARVRSGVTVILPDEGAIAAADVRGGAPGTRETDALAPQNLVEAIHAIVLSGGSVYGLAAADAVAVALGARGVGFRLAPTSNAPPSPIVPAAIIFDLANGGDKAWGEEPPYRRLAAEALANAGQSFALGTAGAGHGARAGGLKGGLGSASAVADDGIIVGAITAVNGSGGVTDQARRAFWAAPFEVGGEFGGLGAAALSAAPDDWAADRLASLSPRNTTIACVATNVALNPAQAQRVAIMAQDGISRAIRPAHAPFDGDVVFALSTARMPLPAPEGFSIARIGALAADCLARAIARGVYEATRWEGEGPPAWRDLPR